MAHDWQLRTIPPALERRWIDDGHWDDQTLGELLDHGLGAERDLEFRVHSRTRPWSGTFGELHEQARRLAAGLRERGIGPGDPVAFQLPNCVEAAVTFYAVALLGAVVVPIVHFYGPKEVGYILRRTGVRAFVTIERFGSIDYRALLDRLEPELAGVDTVGVVDLQEPAPGLTAFDDLLAAEPIEGPVAVDPGSPALIAYTSGTTSDPKGVIHSHRTIGCEIRQLGATQSGEGPPNLMGAPVGHAIGMLGALLLPVWRGGPIHLIDVWDPGHVLALMLEHGLAAGSGATFFLTSLLDHPDCGPAHLELMREVGLGGAPVPNAVADRATAAGISMVRMYGSTEHPSITGALHGEPLDRRVGTDGHPLPGVEVRLVDPDGNEVAPGEPGEILSRGPDCCMGYTDPALTAQAFDDDGWYRTEDVGILDDDGWLRITDRTKDIIIRGGENISAAEIEELLVRLPGVAEAVVVAAPDARLGEHACAFLRLLPGSTPPDLEQVRTALADAGLARQKWPEELRMVEDLPRTASGRVQKFVLRQQLRDEAG
jgi:acyl-CoA synthetase